jgi:hypothetical protein
MGSTSGLAFSVSGAQYSRPRRRVVMRRGMLMCLSGAVAATLVSVATAGEATSAAGVNLILQMSGQIAAPPASPVAPRQRVSDFVAPVAPGTNVLVNDPTLDTPERTTQSEVTLAVLGSTICAGYVDTGGAGLSGFARSTDFGATWTDEGAIPHFSDPVLAVHAATGTIYDAHLIMPAAGGVAISVARSTDDCRSFPDAVIASPDPLPADFNDKPWIAVDNTGGGRDGHVYVCWARLVDAFPGPISYAEIHFSRSTDLGVTFGDDQVLSRPSDIGPFGCSITVGPNGELYVTWANRGGGRADNDIRFRRSLDGGGTWESPVQVNTAPIRIPGTDRIIQCEARQLRPTLNGDIRMLAQAWMAVDTTGGPFDGNLYIVWAHDPPGGVDNSDIFLSRSTNRGLTWSPEVQIAGGTLTDQFEPFVTVGGSGTMSVAWYDRRDDPANNFSIDVYTAFSRDGGATLDPIVRLTDESFPVPPLTGQATSTGNFDPGRSACYMGEYIAIAADTDSFYYAWGDNRHTVFSDTYPDGRPDPDVFFDRQPIPPLPEATRTPTPTPAHTSTPTRSVTPACAGDVDGDGRVTSADIAALVPSLFDEVGTADNVDLNHDGGVSAADVTAIVQLQRLPCATAGFTPATTRWLTARSSDLSSPRGSAPPARRRRRLLPRAAD